jgi:hypothetical protein
MVRLIFLEVVVGMRKFTSAINLGDLQGDAR